jgi:hypothetical protein
MASRRGAVTIDPVTGKMKAAAPLAAGPDGVTKHRDGCLIVDDRYVNAAKELGLGGEAGALARARDDSRSLVGAGRARRVGEKRFRHL